MPEYKLKFIASNGHVLRSPLVVELPDDPAALKEARALLDGQDIEIWQGERAVAYVVPDKC